MTLLAFRWGKFLAGIAFVAALSLGYFYQRVRYGIGVPCFNFASKEYASHEDWHNQRDHYLSTTIVSELAGPRILPVRQRPANEQRHDSYPLVSGDTYRSVCRYTYDETGNNDWNPRHVQPGDLIFAKTDMLGTYFIDRHPQIRSAYILITSNSDDSAPGPHLKFLEDAKLFAWYGQNADTSHPKFHPLPIGFPNREWEHGNIDTLLNTALSLTNSSSRQSLLYVNVGTATNAHRQSILDHIQSWTKQSRVHYAKRGTHEQYLMDMRSSQFVLSPPGNGVDCHRTWEALLMGAVPIVQSSQSFGELQMSSPVLVTRSFSALAVENLTGEHYLSPTGAGVFANYWFTRFAADSLVAASRE